MDTPEASLNTAEGDLQVRAARLATPLGPEEQRTVHAILQGQLQEVQVAPADDRGNRAVGFQSVVPGGAWQVSMHVDAYGAPVSLTANSAAQRLDMRWRHLDDDDWVAPELCSHDHSYAVNRFLSSLRTEGGLQELLEDPAAGKGLLEPATEACLRAVVLSMAGREDGAGQRVCEAVVSAGASPATLHLLNRQQLDAVLRLPDLRPDVCDLRWWPPTCVGRLIERLAPILGQRSQVRSFLTAVYGASEPAGGVNVWPAQFTGGLERGLPRPNAPQLWFLQREHLAHDPASQSATNVLLRALENAYSVADRQRTMQDVAGLSDQDLDHLGVPPRTIAILKRSNGLLCWLRAQGQLQALQEAYQKDDVASGQPKEIFASQLAELQAEDLPSALPLRDAVEAAREHLQALCRPSLNSKTAKDDNTLHPSTAARLLRAYGRFWRLLEEQSLQKVLQESAPNSEAFDLMPKPERERAQAVFERDEQQREDVMEHFFALPMRVQTLLVEAAAQAPGRDPSSLRSALNKVHPERLRLTGRATSTYSSALHAHVGWEELTKDEGGLPAMGKSPQHRRNQLNQLLRRSDETWEPGYPTLLQQALLDYQRSDLGLKYLAEQVEFKVVHMTPVLRRLNDWVPARLLVSEGRYQPEVAKNVQWQQQVGERLMDANVPQPNVERALRTLGQWMRHHERGMAFNPFNNRVALALRRPTSVQEFLQAVGQDLLELRQWLQQSLAEQQEFDNSTQVDLLQDQLQHLGFLDEEVVARAFQVLHELAGPRPASGGQPQEVSIDAPHDEDAAVQEGMTSNAVSEQQANHTQPDMMALGTEWIAQRANRPLVTLGEFETALTEIERGPREHQARPLFQLGLRMHALHAVDKAQAARRFNAACTLLAEHAPRDLVNLASILGYASAHAAVQAEHNVEQVALAWFGNKTPAVLGMLERIAIDCIGPNSLRSLARRGGINLQTLAQQRGITLPVGIRILEDLAIYSDEPESVGSLAQGLGIAKVAELAQQHGIRTTEGIFNLEFRATPVQLQENFGVASSNPISSDATVAAGLGASFG